MRRTAAWIVHLLVVLLLIGTADHALAGGKGPGRAAVRPAVHKPVRSYKRLPAHKRLDGRALGRRRATEALVGGRAALAQPAKVSKPARAALRQHRGRASRLGQRGRLLASPESSASARIDLIRSAKREINTSVYIFSNDRAGRMVLAELRKAARSGVKVRLLLDGFGNGLPRAALAHLISEGVEVAIYNRLTWKSLFRPWRLTHRLHDKLLIIDGAQMVVGGRNIEEGYFGGNKPGYHHFNDVDAHVAGSAARSANGYFRSLWTGPLVQRLQRKDLWVARRATERYGRSIDRASRLASRLHRAIGGQWLRQASNARLRNVEFVHQGPRTLGNGNAPVQKRILRMLDDAVREVEILTPYLVPDRAMLGAIARARDRGVNVRIVTNSMQTARGHEYLTQWAYESMVGALARAGAELWEVSGKRGMHAKTVVADGTTVYVGSYNMDPRSRNLQKEVGVVADSPALARDLLDHGAVLRRGGLMASQGGRVTAQKKQQCKAGCRLFAKYIYGPLARVSGLYNQL